MQVSARAKIAIRGLLHRAGLDLVRSLDPTDLLRRRLQLIERHGIDVIFDVGANAGQYGTTMRALGYTGRLVSFEPSAEAFELLSRAAHSDSGWTVVNEGMGRTEGTAELNVSANSQSSSVLGMLPTHIDADPKSRYLARETVRMSTLRAAIEDHLTESERLLVKIDTQGFEQEVLAGAGDALARIDGMQLELSLVPLYRGQPLIEEFLTELRARGFIPMAIEPDFFHPTTGQLLQADSVFFRSEARTDPDPLSVEASTRPAPPAS